MFDILIWFAGIAVLLWLIGRLLVRLLSRLVPNVGRAMGRYIPRSSEQTLLLVVLALLTALITARPHWAPWNMVISRERLATLQPEALLGAAAALFALLLFATTQVGALEKAARSENTYLGKNVDTYLFGRSRIVKSLSLPVFHLAICALFITPLFWQSLPNSEITWSPQGAATSLGFSPQLLAIALWCACFAVVAGTLLLNVFVTLRNSMVGFRAPFSIDLRIERGIEQTAALVYRELFRKKQTELSTKTRRWLSDVFTDAAQLPSDEQQKYLFLTIATLEYHRRRDDIDGKIADQFNKVSRVPLHHRENRWNAWMRRRRYARITQNLRARTDIALQRARAILKFLDTNVVAPEVFDSLVRQCIEEATEGDNLYAKIFGSQHQHEDAENSCVKREAEHIEAEHILVQPLHNVPELRVRHRPVPRRDGTEPPVQKLPMFIYRALAEVMLPGLGHTNPSRAAVSLIADVIQSAEGLKDPRSREIILRLLVNAFKQCTITHRADQESIDIGQLQQCVTRRRTNDRGATSGDAKGFVEIAEEEAFGTLTSTNSLQPAALNTLLAIVTGWRVPCALLTQLFWGVRGNRPLQSAQLSPFLDAHRRTDWDPHWAREKTAAFIVRSSLNYFVDAPEVQWLFESLNRPLSVDLCVDFLRQEEFLPISDFGLLQFVQWHVIASPPAPRGASAASYAIPEQYVRQLIGSRAAIEAFGNQWDTHDKNGADTVRGLLLEFPSEK